MSPTDIERLLVSYYRAPSVSNWSRMLAIDSAYLTVSIFFIAFSLIREDAAWGIIGYLILLYRIVWGIWQSRRWTPGFQGMITKYEARVAELTTELEKRESQT